MPIEDKIQSNIDLSKHSTFRIGGRAKFFVEIKNKDDLLESLDWAERNNEKFYILAGGSNVLINDKGVDGLVLKFANNDINIRSERIDCGAGTNLIQTARMSAGNSLAGLEWAAGIPGTVGGAIRGNAGAYDSSMSEAVETVEVFDQKSRRFVIFSNRDCAFAYRTSVFKENNNLIIWSAVLKLSKGSHSEIERLIEKYLISREKSQPKLPSAGSIFKNFKIEDLRIESNSVAKWAEEEGAVKNGLLASGWIIDKLGFKGKTMGGVKVSLEHANFIVNTGNGKAEEVVILISYIKQQARTRFKIKLNEEIQYFGF